MALADQMSSGKIGAAMIVGRDHRDAAFRQAAHGEDDRHARRLQPPERARRGAARRRDDEAGDALLHQRFQHLFLAHRIFRRVGDEGHDAGRLEDALHADRQFGEKGIGEIVDDHADDVGMGLAQIGGAAVVDIADILDRLAHLDRGFRPDQPAALQHERHRRFGHARLAGNVEDRRLGPAGHPDISSRFWSKLLERSNHCSNRESIGIFSRPGKLIIRTPNDHAGKRIIVLQRSIVPANGLRILKVLDLLERSIYRRDKGRDRWI